MAFLGTGRSSTRAHSTHLLTAALVVIAALAALAPNAFAVIEKPVATTPPTITGTPKEGVTMKLVKGKWTGGAITYTYQWQRCQPESECENIAGATEQGYLVRYIDVGSQLRGIVTATNTAGTTEAITEKTTTVVGVAPKNTAVPVVSGSPLEGQLLTTTDGSWSGSPALEYTYQWERCNSLGKICSDIAEATGSSYRVAAADVGFTLRADVTDKNVAGSQDENSAVTAVVKHGPPVALDFPVITGPVRQGGTLTVSPGDWKGLEPIEYEYLWESCNAEGSCTHAAGSTYPLGEGDVGNTIKVVATATNSLGTASSSSIATPPILASGTNFGVSWGEDARSQLGGGYQTSWEEYPVPSAGEEHLTAVAQGGSFTMWLHENGTVTEAGAGYWGQLGYGGRKATWEQPKTHVTVSGLNEVEAIAANGESAMALRKDHTVWFWGNNQGAQAGNGKGGFEKDTGENTMTPREVKALNETALGEAHVVSISAGGGQMFALLSSGQVKAWGGDEAGDLGVPFPAECHQKKTCDEKEHEKERVEKAGKFEEIPNMCHTEIGYLNCVKTPTTVTVGPESEEKPLEDVRQVSPGQTATYALLKNPGGKESEGGEVLSWGSDNKGQLGQTLEPGAKTSWTRPAKVMVSATETLKNVVAVEGGYVQAVALLANGTVVGWGDDGSAALGPAANTCGKLNKNGGGTWPCDRYATVISGGLPEGVKVTQLAAGVGFTAVLGSDGHVYTIGSNQYGMLGIGPVCENEGGEMGYGTSCTSSKWHLVEGLGDVTSIAGGLKDVSAVVGHEGTPPQPVLAWEPGPLSTKLQWQLHGEHGNRTALRVWEHPGAEEVAEKETEEGEAEEPTEEEVGTPPVNETLPGLRKIEYVEGVKKVVKGSTYVGQILESSTGNWSGTPPLTYEFRWLRCKGGKCTAITPWRSGGEPEHGEELLLTEEDAGYQFEAQVAARHEHEARGIATTGPSEVVKAEGEGRKATAEYIDAEGLDGQFVTSFEEKPLEAGVLYEYKFQSQGGPKADKPHTFLAAPLP